MLKKARKCLDLIRRAHLYRLRLANGWKTLTAFARSQSRAWKVWIRRMGAEAAAYLRKIGGRLMLSTRALWNRARREVRPLIAAKGRAAFFAVQRWCRTQAEEAKTAALVIIARAKAVGGQLSDLAAGQANGRTGGFNAAQPERKHPVPRRAMAMALAVMVTLSMFPAGAFAGEIDGKDSGADNGIPILTPVDDPGTGGATGGGGVFHEVEWGTDENCNVGYGNLTSAVAYANSLPSGTAYILLNQDESLSESLVFGNGKNTVLNLNGHSISMIQVVGGTNQADRILTVKGNLTLEDTSSGSAGKITKGQGGGVLVDGGSLTMESGSIAGNTADSGSGVLVKNSGSFTMNGGSITDNTASGNGGGVLASGAVTVGGTAKITDNHAGSGTDLPVSNVYVSSTQTIGVSTETPLATGASIGVNTKIAPTAGTPVNITGINENNVSKYFKSDNNYYSVQNGAGNTVQLAKGAAPTTEARWGLAGAGGTVPAVWTDGTFADAMSYANALSDGTAYIQLGQDLRTIGTLTFASDETTVLDLNDHTINGSGGDYSVLTVRGNLTLTDTGDYGWGEITGGNAQSNTNDNQHSGGGVCVLGGTFTMTGGKIIGNSADFGGGVCMREGGTFLMTGGEISGNVATYWNGCGGVFAYAGKFTVGGTAKITDNHAGAGGTLPVDNVFVANMQTIGVSTETPLASGASIGVNTQTAPTDDSPVNITGTNENDVSKYFISDNNFSTIQNGTDNIVQLAPPLPEARWGLAGAGSAAPTSWVNSGGLTDAMNYANGLSSGTAYIQLQKDVQPTVTLTFSSGKTTILDLNGKTIDANHGAFSVLTIKGKLTLKDTSSTDVTKQGKITGGQGTSSAIGPVGGGVQMSGTSSQFTMVGGNIAGNAGVDFGGGVYVGTAGMFTMNDGRITGNTANKDGGGVYLANSSTSTMLGGEISGNAATGDTGTGGGVYADTAAYFTVGGTVKITGNQKGAGDSAVANNAGIARAVSVSSTTPLAKGASIGVTSPGYSPVKITGMNGGDFSAYFASDDPSYSVQNSAYNEVQLVAVPITEARWGAAGTGGTVPATWTNGTLSDAFTYANALSSGTAYIQLQKDVQPTVTLTFSSGKTTILDLNGKTIDAKQGSFSVLTVNGALTLKDTSSTDATKQGKITGGAPKNTVGLPSAGGGVSVNATGSFTMDGGSITGNTTAPGGGVYVNTGSFTMNGGSITGNDSGGFGGGVCVDYGSFTMNGGSITQNTAATGGGVAVNSGSFTMNGGSITGNTTNTEHVKGLGGGVALYTAACVMNGGEITGNSAGTIGGGVQVYSDSSITVSGTVKITGNTAFDSKIADNVYLYPRATISVSGSKPLASGSSIGVKAGTVPTAGTPVNITGTNNSDVSKCFLSDDRAYSIQNKSDDNTVQLVLGAANAAWDGTSAQYFAGGTGTEADPYQIATAEQLCLLSGVINQYDYSNKSNPVSYNTATRKVVDGQDAQTCDYLRKAYYKLTADIALNGTTGWESWNAAVPTNRWKPIGAYYYTFNGHFDGNGKTVSGMYFSDTSDSDWNGVSGGSHVGLFGYTAGATVENVTVAQSYVRGSGYVGGVVGGNDQNIYTGILTVTNCHNLGTVSGSYVVGGVVGLSVHALGGVISSCTNSGAVSGTNGVGGIVSDGQIVTNCQNSGTVSGVTTVGGVVGQSQGNVTNCRNTGAVSGTGSNIGGVVGGQYSPSVVSSCASPKGLVTDATGDIGEWQTPSDTYQYIGHIIGWGIGGNGNSSGSISNGVSISPADATVAPGGTQVFTAKVGDGTGTQTVTWSLVNGDDKVSMDANGKVTVASGASDGKSYAVKAVSTEDPTKCAMATVTVGSPIPTAPIITIASLLGGVLGTAYCQTIAATGSTPMTWSVASGSLPGGLSINTSTGVISGTPMAAGTFQFTVKAENSVGSDSKALSITVTSPISSVSVSPATATVKKTKAQQFTATVSGTAADKSVKWSVSGGTKSSIDQNGLLTVSATETASTLTVKATSTVDGSKSGTATVTVTAAPKICTVTFDSDGGSAVSPIGGIEEGKTTSLPDAPTKDSCRFDGWFTAKNGGGTPFTALTPVTDSITVYAKWTHLVTVAGTVVNYDNTPISNASVTLNPTYGTSAATADAQGKFSFASIPEDLFTVTAKFSDNSTVTVNVTGDYGNVKIVRPKPSIAITTQPQDAMIVKGVAGQNAVFTIAGTRTPYLENSVAYQWYWLKGTSPDPLKDTKMDGSGSQMTFNADNGNIPSDPGTYRLYGYAYDSTANIEAFSRIATLKVVGTNTVAGAVKKADGTLISGAKVELKYADGTWPYGSVAMTSSTNPQTTGLDGAYRFETVPDGRYTLVITLPNGGKIISGPYSFPGTNPPAHPTDPIDPGIVIPDAVSIRINGQPQDATVKNGTAVSLTADASSTDGTALTYQWYSSGKNSNSGGTEISGAVSASYSPATANKGTAYYYCVVSGGSLAPVTTRAAKVTVFTYGVIQGTVQNKQKQPVNGAAVKLINIDTPAKTGFTSSQNPQTTAADGKYKFADVPDGIYRLEITLPDGPIFVVNPIYVPNVIPNIPVTPPDKAVISITSQPKNQTVVLNDTAKFTVNAGVSTGGTVLYQWYGNTANSTSGGTAIDGATSATYCAPTDTKGVTYYYCVMQATGADAVTSGIAKLTVRSTPLNNLMTIQGVVKDENGSPVENAVVTLSPKAGTSENPQTTKSDGHYKFENLPDGTYVVTVKLPNGGVVTKTITINDGDITPAEPNDITVPTDNKITIAQQPTDIEVTTDMTASFTVNATAAKAGVTYQWYRNAANSNSGGEKLDGKTDAALTLDKQPEGISYYYCVVSSAGAADTATSAAKLTVTKAGGNTGSLGGGIVSDDNGNPVKGATVKLMKNGTEGIQFGSTVTTGDNGKFQFTNIPYGSYSLVAQKDVSTVTRQITIRDASVTENLTLPSGAKITKVVITGSNTPSTAAGNLEAMFDDADNAIAQQPGAKVEIRLEVEKEDSPSDKDDIDAALGENQQVGVYLNAKLVKIISGTSDDGEQYIQPLAGQTLHIVLDIPKELQGKSGYHILRSHTENGVTDVSAISAVYDDALQTLSFDADAFSTYAVAYTQALKYSVTVTGSQSANSGTGLYEAGDTVTIQAGTRSGYSFTGWTSQDGVTFANAGSAATTFSMPAQNVTVAANWKYTGGGNGGNGGNGGGNGGTNPGDNNNPGGNPNPNPNPNPAPAPSPNGGKTNPGGGNNNHGGTANHGGSTNNPGGGSSNGGNTNAGGTASGSNNGTGGKTTPGSNGSSSNPESDTSKLNAAKDIALQKLADARQKAIDALPKALTDEQRKKAIDEIDQIYSAAVKNIQNADSADAIGGIADQTSHDFANVTAGAGGAKPAQAPAGAKVPKPFLLLSAVLAAAAVLGAALAWRRRKANGGNADRGPIIATATAAAAILLFVLTTGWQGIAIANLWTIAVAVLAAGSLVCALRRR